MTRRDFLTPSLLPGETIERRVSIPSSQDWLGLMNAALLMLTQEWRYEQVNETDLTPEQTAARAYQIYEEYLMGGGGVDVRQNPVNPCWLEKSYDGGVTWEVYADVSLCVAPVVAASGKLLPDNVRVEGGKPQMDLGGETWVDVAPSPIKQTVPRSAPVPGDDDEAKICLAAARVARAYSEAYRATFGAFTAEAFNTLGRMNNFLFQLNQGLFNMIYSPHEGILESWLFDQQDFEENYEAPALTEDQEEELTCLLIEHASIIVGERVIFDHEAITDNLIGRLGLNPGVALTYLFDQVGPEATDWAGGSNIIPEGAADCDFCEEPPPCMNHIPFQFRYDTRECLTPTGAFWAYSAPHQLLFFNSSGTEATMDFECVGYPGAAIDQVRIYVQTASVANQTFTIETPENGPVSGLYTSGAGMKILWDNLGWHSNSLTIKKTSGGEIGLLWIEVLGTCP